MARISRKHLYDADIDNNAVMPEPNGLVYNAGGYTRLSSDGRKKRGDSLETQQNIIKNFVAAASDIRLVEVYSDNSATGTNFERPGFQRMLADIERGKINCIIVKDLTRFGRNAIDAGYYLERVLPLLGVRFIAITDSYDSMDGDAGILLPLKNIISEAYALDISRKCRSVQRQNIADGKFVGRLAPYGYRKDPDDCHRLIIDDETAPVVKSIFQWASEGKSCNGIANRLTEMGVPSPSHYNFFKGYNTSEKLLGELYWKRNTIYSTLTDRVYVGDMVQGKSQKVNNKKIMQDPSKWICVTDTHEPIVSRELFNYVQESMSQIKQKALAIQASSTPYDTNVFLRKVFCARCGHPMKRKRQKNGEYWYRCHTKWDNSKDACTVVSVKESALKVHILTILHKQAEAILGKYITLETESEKTDDAAELREINRQIDKDGHMLKSLYESMVSGRITKDEFIKMKTDYEIKLVTLSRKAEEIQNRKLKLKSKTSEFHDITEAVAAALRSDRLSEEIIGRLVQEIRVYPDKSFIVLFRYRDEFKEVRNAG